MKKNIKNRSPKNNSALKKRKNKKKSNKHQISFHKKKSNNYDKKISNLTKIEGILSKHKNGFGFISQENSDEDIFIPSNKMKEAMDGDKVKVVLIPNPEVAKSQEGWIVEILERNVKEVVGTFEKSKKFGFVVPENNKMRNQDIFISQNNFGKAEDGDIVVAKIIKYPDSQNNAEGKITEIISKKDEKNGDIKALVRSQNLKLDFDNNIKYAAKKVKAEFDNMLNSISQDGEIQKLFPKRKILTDRTILTIDGADSKDLDDGISLNILENGNYLLGVHIADVSHYVTQGSILDEEAFKRGTSIYLLDTVIPMLPTELSNNVCSLNPDEYRLTLSVDMEIDIKGKVINHNIYESIIKSNYRLVYDDVSDILENDDKGQKEKYSDIVETLNSMEVLAKILKNVREQQGSLDFDLSEAKITLDKDGVPLEIGIANRRIANKIIEEFMLIANQTVAEHFFWLNIPFVYRVHENPDDEKIDEFRNFIKNFGVTLKGSSENIHPKVLSNMMESIKGEDFENVVNSILLRTMKKAFYDPICQGHFGLGMKYYCHFTSPIRRYPDLMIHRIIKETLNGKLSDNRLSEIDSAVSLASENSSVKERQAIELERQVEKLKKTEYMESHLFEPFDGIISGVTNYGFYVELPNTIEGLVHLRTLKDDFYEYQDKSYRIVGEKSGKVYALGDKVKVVAVNTSIEDREIDFKLYK